MPSLQSTLHTRPPAQAAPQAPAVQASFGQGPEPMMVRSPSLDTWGGPSAGGPPGRRRSGAQRLPQRLLGMLVLCDLTCDKAGFCTSQDSWYQRRPEINRDTHVDSAAVSGNTCYLDSH